MEEQKDQAIEWAICSSAGWSERGFDVRSLALCSENRDSHTVKLRDGEEEQKINSKKGMF